MKTRMSKNRSKRIRIYLKSILRGIFLILSNVLELIVYLIKIIIKLIYKLVFKFNTVIGKLFMKLPRITKVLIIYVLILTFTLDFIGIIKNKKIITIMNAKAEEIIYVEPAKEEIVEEQKCNLDEISCKIYNKGLELKMSEEQILISIAISKWETGNYTSTAFNKLNNVGGMMCNDGLIEYETLEIGIEKFLINLKNNYFGIGLDTIEKIQPKYCPIGAKNDPNGLNKYWLEGVKAKYNEMKGGE